MLSKPENNNLRLKTTVQIKFQIKRKKKLSFFDHTKLQIDQFKKKIEEKFIIENRLLLEVAFVD